MKNIIITLLSILITWTGSSLKAQDKSDGIIGNWVGTLSHGEKSRQIEINFSKAKDGSLNTRWSIPETGIVQAPLHNTVFTETSGDLDINNKFIQGRFSEGRLEATINGHGFTGELKLQKSDDSILPVINQESITFKNGEVTLAGRLLKPGGSGPFPAVIFVHGSGPGLAADWNYAARRITKLGFACLIYDKRGSGASTDNWITSSLDDLAKDVSEAVKMLGSKPEIDANRIGLWGHSQGGWIGPLASKVNGKVGFQVMVSGGGITPRDSEMFSYLKILDYGNFEQEVYDEVENLVNQYFDYLSTGIGREALSKRIEEAKSKPWYNYVNLHRVMVSDKNRPNWQWVADYDPRVDIAKVKEPVLVIYGGEDIIQDKGLSISAWLEGLKNAHNENYQLEVFPKGNHGLRIGDHDSGPIFWQDFVPGYWETAERWLQQNVLNQGN